jgi:prepilin-type N-terminal cleavage/methylation domain-containing protein
MNNRGFTLVELLTVVAIIGILSAMTLVTFPAARTRAKDGVIMSDMGQLRSEAEIIYAIAGNTYTEMAGTESTTAWDALIDDIETQSGDTVVIGASGQAYCVTITLNSNDEWCIDSTGFAGTATLNCTPSIFTCK